MKEKYLLNESKYSFSNIYVWPLMFEPENNGSFMGFKIMPENDCKPVILKFMDGSWFVEIPAGPPSHAFDARITKAYCISPDEIDKYFWTNQRVHF